MASIIDTWNGKSKGPGKRYKVRYRAPDGTSRSVKVDGNREDAKRVANTLESNRRSGDWIDPRASKVKFGAYAESWRATKLDVRERTLENVDSRLRRHLLPTFGKMQMGSIRPADVRAWVKKLSGQLSPSSVRGIYRTFSQIMKQAEIDEVIRKSPCIGIQLPKETKPKQKQHVLTPAQVRDLAEAIQPRYQALIYLAAYGGLRWGELAALQVSRVNLLHGWVDVVEAASEPKGKFLIGPTKTGKERQIPIPRFLGRILDAHLEKYSVDGFVFTSAEGSPLRHHNFYRRHYKRAVAAAGLSDGVRFHDLRHTCAGFLIADGRSMEEVKTHLGHSSIRVTSDRYGSLFPESKSKLRDGLDRIFETG